MSETNSIDEWAEALITVAEAVYDPTIDMDRGTLANLGTAFGVIVGAMDQRGDGTVSFQTMVRLDQILMRYGVIRDAQN